MKSSLDEQAFSQWASFPQTFIGIKIHSQTQIERVYSVLSRKNAGRMADSLNRPRKIPKPLLLGCLQEPDLTKNGVLLSYLGWWCSVITVQFKKDDTDLWVLNYFPPCNHFPTSETLLASHYSIAITTANIQTLVPSFQTFPARTHYATCTQCHGVSSSFPSYSFISELH